MEAVLDAVKRQTKGKNEARRLRAEGKIPAVLYGASKAGEAPAPEPVAVDPKPFMRILHSASGLNTLITLKVQGGIDARVLACAIHGVLSGPAIDRIEKAPIDKLIITNTIPLTAERAKCQKIVVLSVARLLGQAIRSIHEETSVSSLFV